MTISKKVLTALTVLGLTCILASTAFAMKAEYNYMSAGALNKAIQDGADVAIVDIQVADEFAAHHIKGAIETNSYPVKSDADKAKLDAAISTLKDTNQNIVIICPRGQGGAERTAQHLASEGIAPYRLFILTEGQGGWPFAVEQK